MGSIFEKHRSEQLRVAPAFADLLRSKHSDFNARVQQRSRGAVSVDFTDFTDMLALSAQMTREVRFVPNQKRKTKLGFDELRII